MIVCLFGASCVGKTTVAQRFAALSGLPLRSCGDAVRIEALKVGLHRAELPDSAHVAIDTATVAWALENRSCIVEGRFLDAVFASVDVPTILISLFASETCRLERARLREGASISPEDLHTRDAQDEVFRARIYGTLGRDAPRQSLDLSWKGTDECARQLLDLIGETSPRGPPRI